MRRVVLESPYSGNVERNVAYAKLCIKDCLKRGEAPIASHLLFTQEGILDDLKAEERSLGMLAGHEWIAVAQALVVYTDYGISKGMTLGIEEASRKDCPIYYRQILGRS